MKTNTDLNVHKASDLLSNYGNRVATVLFYLSVPVAGGATVFTDTGARLTPMKVSRCLFEPRCTITPFQVNNYGMAGQYEPHYDMATNEEQAFLGHIGGNRVATILIYMGRTEAGGATIFTDAGARVTPQTVSQRSCGSSTAMGCSCPSCSRIFHLNLKSLIGQHDSIEYIK